MPLHFAFYNGVLALSYELNELEYEREDIVETTRRQGRTVLQ